MARSGNQKMKQLYLMQILLQNTDENHFLNATELIQALKAYDIEAERKSIYSDIESLKLYGLDIEKSTARGNAGYYIASREFEIPELKLLVDAVQSSRFITLKKSEKLIKKIEALASRYEAVQLQRQVYVTNRIKTQNESVYYNVDDIHSAIRDHVQITFQYMEWTIDKEMRPRKNGERYQVSPLSLVWDDENYYLIAYDDQNEIRKHFRVDKMQSIQMTEERATVTQNQFDPAVYSKMMFGMFGGEEESVKLTCDNHYIGVLIDRFGKDIPIQKISDTQFKTHVSVVVSDQFFGWIMALGNAVEITAPISVREQFLERVQCIQKKYQTKLK